MASVPITTFGCYCSGGGEGGSRGDGEESFGDPVVVFDVFIEFSWDLGCHIAEGAGDQELGTRHGESGVGDTCCSIFSSF
jgi:hypothetical protein